MLSHIGPENVFPWKPNCWKYLYKDILAIAEFFTLKPVNSNIVCYRTDFNHSLNILSIRLEYINFFGFLLELDLGEHDDNVIFYLIDDCNDEAGMMAASS
jgi:hypothetical protein